MNPPQNVKWLGTGGGLLTCADLSLGPSFFQICEKPSHRHSFTWHHCGHWRLKDDWFLFILQEIIRKLGGAREKMFWASLLFLRVKNRLVQQCSWEHMVWCVCSVMSRLFCNPWTVAHQAPLSMEFSRQKYWSGLPFLPLGALSNPGIKLSSLASPVLAGRFFTTAPSGNFPELHFQVSLWQPVSPVGTSCSPSCFPSRYAEGPTLYLAYLIAAALRRMLGVV